METKEQLEASIVSSLGEAATGVAGLKPNEDPDQQYLPPGTSSSSLSRIQFLPKRIHLLAAARLASPENII